MTRNNTTSKQILLITVPNDDAGREQIKTLRKQMKESKSNLRIILYGRGHRFGKGRHRGSYKGGTWIPTNHDNSFQSHVPLKVAQRIAVYVTGRGNPPSDY